METLLLDFLNQCGFSCQNISSLDSNYRISREILVNNAINYRDIVKKFVPIFKKYMSSSQCTALHSCAESNQRWPLLNLVRQVLRFMNYQLKPIRLSAGYTPSGKKKYNRFFEIQKLKAHS